MSKPTTIRIPDLPARCAAAGITPDQLSLARLSQTQVALLLRGDAVPVADAGAVARLLDLAVDAIAVRSGDAAPAEGAVEAFDDREPVMGDAPAPRSSAREDAPDVPTVPPMEAALRGAVEDGEGRYRDEDLELVGAVLSLGEAPSGVSRRELSAIARGWLDLAVTVRGREDGAEALIALAQTEGEGRVRAMALKIAARLVAQSRAARAAKGAKKPKGDAQKEVA